MLCDFDMRDGITANLQRFSLGKSTALTRPRDLCHFTVWQQECAGSAGELMHVAKATHQQQHQRRRARV